MVRWNHQERWEVMTVCFFGHKDAPESVRVVLEQEIECLIEGGAAKYAGMMEKMGKPVKNLYMEGA